MGLKSCASLAMHGANPKYITMAKDCAVRSAEEGSEGKGRSGGAGPCILFPNGRTC